MADLEYNVDLYKTDIVIIKCNGGFKVYLMYFFTKPALK